MQFQTFATPHLVAMAVTLAIPVVLSALVRRSPSGRAASLVGRLLAAILLGNEVLHWIVRASEFGFAHFVRNNLPLHACGISVLATAATLFWRNQKAYEIAYFWGLVGASNAVITPSLEQGFPAYRFFQYFIAHSGIVTGVLFATWGLRMRPTIRGLVQAFVCLNGFAVLLAAFNALSGSNYMYLSAPPVGTESPFFFAEWPWYILILDGIALVAFFVVLSPFLLRRAGSSASSTAEATTNSVGG